MRLFSLPPCLLARRQVVQNWLRDRLESLMPRIFFIICVWLAMSASAWAQAANQATYKVVDGNKVDAETMKGFRAWRSAACDRCHGANQEGMVGPSLIQSLKTLSRQEFAKLMSEGRPDKGMPNFATNPSVMNNLDQLYTYLKARSDGAIKQAKVEPLP